MRWLGAGRPWLGTGPPSARGSTDGVAIPKKGEVMAERKKAPDDGVYTWNGRQYRARAGELMPPGARFGALEDEDATPEERAKAGRRRRRAAGRGASETTPGTGPEQTG